MNAVKEIIVPKVLCPYCQQIPTDGSGLKIYKTAHLPNGDTRRYVRCLVCNRKFHVLETIDIGKSDYVPYGGIPLKATSV